MAQQLAFRSIGQRASHELHGVKQTRQKKMRGFRLDAAQHESKRATSAVIGCSMTLETDS